MFRRGGLVLAAGIPRSAWDPAHFNTNAPDSFAVDIAARRHWPAKKWSIGLEPRTPREWLQFSLRNLAYAYNGALRSCSSFPEMLVHYKEMRQRGVKVDVDTMNVLLTRAARYDKIDVDDVFRLFDELVGLGARPDLSAVETLHTVLEHSAGKPLEWREAQRRKLVELYNFLALGEIERLGGRGVDALLAAQLARVRGNLRQLSAGLSPVVHRRYFAVVGTAEGLLRGVQHFLWEFVRDDHAALEVPALGMRVPFVASVMRRPSLEKPPAETPPSAFEDTDVCGVFLAAVERFVDGPFHDARPFSARRMYLSLLTMLTSSGVLYTAELIAQLMEVVKFSRTAERREEDAMRLLRYALRGSSASSSDVEAAYRRRWRHLAAAVDGRVVGRYLASRDLWSARRLCYDDHYAFPGFHPPPLPSTTDAAVEPAIEPDANDAATTAGAHGSDENRGVGKGGGGRTAAALQLRWEDAKRLIEKTGVLREPHEEVGRAARDPTPDDPETASHANREAGKPTDDAARRLRARMEVFTGLAVLLRGAATGRRYGNLEAAFSFQAVGGEDDEGPLFADGLSYDVWVCILRCVRELYEEMEAFLAAHATTALAPEFECWEAMILTLRCVMDFCALHTQQRKAAGMANDGTVEKLFNEAAAFRARLVEESKDRFDGRFRILWLHEA